LEQQLKYKEWFFQSDYDLETAQHMLQAGRNVYCIFMCHLSLEKALKGLFIRRLNQFPPKLHDLMYFVEKLALTPEDLHKEFLIWMNRKGITTRYTEDLKKMISQFSHEYTEKIFQQTKTIQQWIIKQQ
jgi:HEPN domain-containing protein